MNIVGIKYDEDEGKYLLEFENTYDYSDITIVDLQCHQVKQLAKLIKEAIKNQGDE